MPMYEYKCKKCGHRFEKIQQFSDAPVKKCPKCKKGSVEKLISQSSIKFKGTGWYVTDYAGKSTVPAESDSKSEPKSETKSETKTESTTTDVTPDKAVKESKKESKKEKKT